MTCCLLELQENLDDLQKQKAQLRFQSLKLETEIIHLRLQIEALMQEQKRLKVLRQVDESKDSFDDDDF